MRFTRFFTALAVVSVSLISEAVASDWPEFRGPTGQGTASDSGLPLEWAGDRNVAWQQTIPGKGWSSPVVVHGQVYLTTADAATDGGGLSLCVLALDEHTGKLLWNKEVFHSQPDRIHGKNSHASPTPIVENGRIYAHFGHQGTACLDTKGKILWTNTTLGYSPVHGNGGSPALVDDLLIFSCDGGANPFVVALNKADGKVRWRVERVTPSKKKFSFSTPLLITVKGQKQLISPGSGAVCAYEPATGKELWRVRYGEGYSVIPRPVYADGLLFLSSGFDRPIIYAIRPDGQGDVTDTHVAWTLTKGAPNTPSLLAVGSEIYAVSDGGIASCLDAKTGQVYWQERLEGNYSASPVYADGRIYFQNETGTGTVIQLGKTFVKLAQNSLGERSLASYAVADGSFFIRTESHLYRIANQKQSASR